MLTCAIHRRRAKVSARPLKSISLVGLFHARYFMELCSKVAFPFDAFGCITEKVVKQQQACEVCVQDHLKVVASVKDGGQRYFFEGNGGFDKKEVTHNKIQIITTI